MSSDGAHLGVTAGRALSTIVGGDPPPTDDERVTIRELEQRIRARPLPGDGEPPWKDHQDDGAYSEAAESLAHAFLVLADERPELLTEQRFYDGHEMDDQGDEHAGWWREHMAGKPKDLTEAVWEAFKARWPDGDDWLGGCTGFQVGWALNAARAIKRLPPAPNPAIMTVAAPEETGETADA